jgi:hypothetical protein
MGDANCVTFGDRKAGPACPDAAASGVAKVIPG